MSRMADFARAFGYGTDPAGDAARRDSMDQAKVDGPELDRLIRDAVERDLGRRAARILTDARRAGASPRPTPDAYPAPVPLVDGHELLSVSGPAGTHCECECGRWGGVYTGPRSRRRVLDDWAAHVAAEVRAAGPIKVVAERADQPPELEP